MNGTGLSIFLFFIGNPITIFVFPLGRPLFLTLRGKETSARDGVSVEAIEVTDSLPGAGAVGSDMVFVDSDIGPVGSGMKAVAADMFTTSMTLSSVMSPFTTSTTSIWLLIKDNYSQRGKYQFGCYQR